MIKNGEVSILDLLDTLLQRIEKVNPKINAIVILNDKLYEDANNLEKEAKKGIEKPLLGIPITIKDNIVTEGLKTTYGSKLYENWIPSEDAVVVERLREADALIIGKTNLPEFALVAITDNPLFGPTKNP